MFCSKCGYSYVDGSKFCPACGVSLAQQLAPQPTTVDTPIKQPVTAQQPAISQPIAQPRPVQQATPQPAISQPIAQPRPVQQVTPQPAISQPIAQPRPVQQTTPQPAISQPVAQPRPVQQTTPQPVTAQPKKDTGKKVAKGCILGCLGTLIVGALLVVGFIFLIDYLIPDDEFYEPSMNHGEDTYEPSSPSNNNYYDDYEYDSPEDISPSYNDLSNNYSKTGLGVYGQSLGLTDVRSQYTTIYGDGSDTYTLMIYIIGSDLESYSGYASDDIQEMLNSSVGSNVNVILMTGGTDKWWNSNISSRTCQYWQIKNGSLVALESDLGSLNMTSESTLTNFITYSTSKFPANRYSLIMWDHGGGTFSGFGYDENYPNDTLTLENIGNALKASNTTFDFVGFDACLMGTMETAFMLQPYADYMIASPESEPATGWYYTDFLTSLENNPSINTVELAVEIIDDYVEKCCDDDRRPQATLSLIELRQVPYMYSVFCDYFTVAQGLVESQNYASISVARSEAKDYGESEYEQVDATDFVQRAGITGGDNVLAAISNAVIYYYNSPDMSNSYGLAFYFPYDYPRYYSEIQTIMTNLGFSDAYMGFFNQFISVMTTMQSGHRSTSGDTSIDYSSESWYNPDVADSYIGSADATYSELLIVESGPNFVLQLTDEEWDLITMIELQVLLDDGNGYYDLGSDNVFEYDKNGDLIIAFDYTWVTLDGHTVPFYAEVEEYISDRDWYTYGWVPAQLNGTDSIELIVYWDDENPYGYVAGYRMANESATPLAKGLFQLQSGDVLEWVFDYYTYDMDYEGSYIMGNSYTVTSSDIEVSYDYVGDNDALVYFQLTDIYNNIYDTEAIIYSDY